MNEAVHHTVSVLALYHDWGLVRNWMIHNVGSLLCWPIS